MQELLNSKDFEILFDNNVAIRSSLNLLLIQYDFKQFLIFKQHSSLNTKLSD